MLSLELLLDINNIEFWAPYLLFLFYLKFLFSIFDLPSLYSQLAWRVMAQVMWHNINDVKSAITRRRFGGSGCCVLFVIRRYMCFLVCYLVWVSTLVSSTETWSYKTPAGSWIDDPYSLIKTLGVLRRESMRNRNNRKMWTIPHPPLPMRNHQNTKTKQIMMIWLYRRWRRDVQHHWTAIQWFLGKHSRSSQPQI